MKIPRNVLYIADACAPKDTRRCMDAVQVSRRDFVQAAFDTTTIVSGDESGYRVDASDGKILARVEGPCDKAENSEKPIVVHRDAWRAALKTAKRDGFVDVAVIESKVVITANGLTSTLDQVEGKPFVADRVWPSSPVHTFEVDARYLRRLLDIALHFAEEGRVRITFHAGVEPVPVEIHTGRADQHFSGLFMPLSPPVGKDSY